MMQRTIPMARRKKIGLVAHDNREELIEWAKSNCKLLAEHSLYSTRTTGKLLKNRLGLRQRHNLNVQLPIAAPTGSQTPISDAERN